MAQWLCLVAGSMAGGAARYALAGMSYRIFGSGFPHGTLVVNLSGCFLIGALESLSGSKFSLSPNLRILLMTGFCGAFTTLSALMLESNNLLKNGEALPAFANVAATVIGGFILFRLGLLLGLRIT